MPRFVEDPNQHYSTTAQAQQLPQQQQKQEQISTRLQMINHIIHVLLLTSVTQITRTAAAPRPNSPSSASSTAPHPLSLHVSKTCLIPHACNDTLNEIHLQRIERNMDLEVSACDDFHRYACGNWKPPSAHNTTATMIQLAEELLTARCVELFEGALMDGRATKEQRYAAAEIRAMQRQQIRRERTHNNRRAVQALRPHTIRHKGRRLEKKVNVEQSANAQVEAEDFDFVFAKLLRYYRVCRRAEQLTLHGYHEQLHAEGLLHKSHRHWQEMLANFARYGYGEQFVFFRVRQQNATQHDITVLPHDVHKRVNLTEEIYDLLRLHTHKNRADLGAEFRALETDVEAVVSGMCATNRTKQSSATTAILPTMVSDGVEALDPLSDQPPSPLNAEEDCDRMEVLTVGELTARCGEIDWQRFIGAPLGRHLHAEDLIRVESVETVCKLARYHNQAQHADINFLYTLARFLNYLEEQQYNPVRLGSSDSATCVRHMRKTLSVAMTYVYDGVYYAPVRAESDGIIRSIFAQLKAEFARTIARNRMQFEADVVAYIQRKLQTLRLNVGNLPPAVNSSFYVDHIWKLNVSSDNFHRNHLHALAFTYGQLRRLASRSTKNHSRSSWYTFNYHEPTFVDNLDSTPYYFCLSNMIIVPQAYLQMPFYDRHFWPALLYGDLANTLGHELIHSFDSNFLEYDHAGNMNELMMQRISTNVNFARNIQCLSENTKFLSERIADVSGTRLALNAFMRDSSFLQRNGRLYFLQFAQFFCSNADELTLQLLDPWHDSDAVRLNYTLAQIPEFREAFNCPAGSPMVAAKRCEMW